MLTTLSQIINEIEVNEKELFGEVIKFKIKGPAFFILVKDGKLEKTLNLPAKEKGSEESSLNKLVEEFYKRNILPSTTKGGKLSFCQKNAIKVITIKSWKEFLGKYSNRFSAKNLKTIKEDYEKFLKDYEVEEENVKIYVIIIEKIVKRDKVLEEFVGLSDRKQKCIICDNTSNVIKNVNAIFDTVTGENRFFVQYHSDISFNISICYNCALKLLTKASLFSFSNKEIPQVAGGFRIKCFPYLVKEKGKILKALEDFNKGEGFDEIIKNIERSGIVEDPEYWFLDCYLFEKESNKIDIKEFLESVKLKHLIDILKNFEEFKKEMKIKKLSLFDRKGILEAVLIKRKSLKKNKIEPTSQRLLHTLLRRIFLGQRLSDQENKLLIRNFNKKIRSLVYDYKDEEKTMEWEIRNLILLYTFLGSKLSHLLDFTIDLNISKRDNKNMEVKSAKDYLVFIGNVLRKIDDAMKQKDKKPLGIHFLGKETLTLEDIKKISGKISHRALIYLEKERLPTFEPKENVWEKIEEELEDLEKKDMIKFYLTLGYFSEKI